MPGSGARVDCGSDGVWSVDGNGVAAKWNGTSWDEQRSNLKDVTVSSAVWGLDTSNRVLQQSRSTWKLVGQNFYSVSAGVDGTLWGVRKNGRVFSFDSEKGDWSAVGSKGDPLFKDIAVAVGSTVFALDQEGSVYSWYEG
jgi:alpha-tubulin suppressor-like RCC1 family protein